LRFPGAVLRFDLLIGTLTRSVRVQLGAYGKNQSGVIDALREALVIPMDFAR
jgi:hypothetical protein